MKKRILFICLLGILSGLITLGGTYLYRNLYRSMQKETQAPISIMVASDMHYLSPDYTGEYFKEPASIFDGKMTHYSSEYLDAFLDEAIQTQPTAVILSGDLTLNGAKKSHEELIEKLTTVQDAGIDVLVIPGNHDVDSGAGDYSGEEPVYVENYTSDDFISGYELFGPAQAISRDESTFSYIYQSTPYLRIIMLDTNCYGKCYVHDETLLWLENELKKAKDLNMDVISVTHQNLHIHNELLYFTYQLYNADELLALYETYDVKLNLSGHVHVQSIVTNTTVPEIAIGSLAVPNSNYGLITYDGKTISYETKQTDVSGYENAIASENPDLLDYETYSRNYFEDVAREQAYSHLAEQNLSQEEISTLADTYAQINSAYFSGEMISEDDFSEGLQLWRTTQKESFIHRYIEVMLKEAQTDNLNLTITLKSSK